jgi:hypothetical protein
MLINLKERDIFTENYLNESTTLLPNHKGK